MKAQEIVGANRAEKSRFIGVCGGLRWEFALRCFWRVRRRRSMEAGEPGRARVRPARRDTFRRRTDTVQAKQSGSGLARQRLELVCCSWLCIIAAE